jgi:hypothetical protein
LADLETRLRIVRETAQLEAEIATAMGERADMLVIEANALEKQQQIILQQLDRFNDIEGQMERRVIINEKLEEQQELLNKGTDRQKENAKLIIEDLQEELDLIKEIVDEEGNINQKMKDRLMLKIQLTEEEKKIRKQAKKIEENLFGAVGVTDSWKNSLIGTLNPLRLFNADFKQTLGLAAKNIFSMHSLSNIIGSTLQKVQESTIAMVLAADSTSASFNKVMGTAGRLDVELLGLNQSGREFGLTLSDSAQITQTLADRVDMFTKSGSAARTSIVRTGQQLALFGVEAGTAGDALNLFTRSLGQTVEQAGASTMKLVETALAVGEPPEKLMQEFNQLIPEFSRYGERAASVFGKVARQAKALGTELGTVISISEQFDTFESAGETAGKLMGILGQPLDVMGLMKMDPDQKLKYIMGMIDQSDSASRASWFREKIGEAERRGC